MFFCHLMAVYTAEQISEGKKGNILFYYLVRAVGWYVTYSSYSSLAAFPQPHWVSSEICTIPCKMRENSVFAGTVYMTAKYSQGTKKCIHDNTVTKGQGYTPSSYCFRFMTMYNLVCLILKINHFMTMYISVCLILKTKLRFRFLFFLFTFTINFKTCVPQITFCACIPFQPNCVKWTGFQIPTFEKWQIFRYSVEINLKIINKRW